MVTLDKTKPYGVVCGNHHAKFEQDNKLFDAQGHEITEAAPKETKDKDKPAKKPQKADA